MNFDRLEVNLCDIVKEQQIKLGYRKERVYLYYPHKSLLKLLEMNEDTEPDKLDKVLADFKEYVFPRLGTLEITYNRGRYCIQISKEGSEYIHDNTKDNEFIVELIGKVRTHGTSFDEILDVFHKYSDRVHVERTHNGEFDYLIYFEDGKPDDFRYCISDEMGHIIYHRYTADDYIDFGF